MMRVTMSMFTLDGILAVGLSAIVASFFVFVTMSQFLSERNRTTEG